MRRVPALACAAAALTALTASAAHSGSSSKSPDTAARAFEARAAAAYGSATKKKPQRRAGQSLRFTITGGHLSAATPVKFWSALGYPRTVEVNHTSAPGHASIVFPWEAGTLNVWMYEMRGARFYGECDIVTDPLPQGATFRPRVQERMTNETPPQTLRMTYDDHTKKWFFITSQSQIDIPILMINATDNQLPVGFNWILRSCTILPFKG